MKTDNSCYSRSTITGKSLGKICEGISNNIFSIYEVEITSQQLKSILGLCADPKKSKHIKLERLYISNMLAVIFADRPLDMLNDGVRNSVLQERMF